MTHPLLKQADAFAYWKRLPFTAVGFINIVRELLGLDPINQGNKRGRR